MRAVASAYVVGRTDEVGALVERYKESPWRLKTSTSKTSGLYRVVSYPGVLKRFPFRAASRRVGGLRRVYVCKR